MKIRMLALTMCTAVLSVAACGGGGTEEAVDIPDDLAALTAAAKKEGSLTWYTGTSPAGQKATVEAFEKEYGIDVEAVTLSTSDIAQRVQSEAASQDVQSDVVSMADAGLNVDFRKKDLIKAIPDSWYGELADEYRTGGDAAAVIAMAPIAIPYSPKNGVTISSWDDLIDPKNKGNITLVDPNATGPRGPWAQMWTVILNAPDLGEQYVKALAKQDLTITSSSLPGLEMIASGETGAVIAAITPSIDPLKAQGVDLENFVPTNPSYSFRAYVAATQNAPHPNAAALFVRFLTSEAGSQAYNTGEKAVSPLGNLEGTFPMPEGGIEPLPSDEDIEKGLATTLKLLDIS